jgi:hypothetical protein
MVAWEATALPLGYTRLPARGASRRAEAYCSMLLAAYKGGLELNDQGTTDKGEESTKPSSWEFLENMHIIWRGQGISSLDSNPVWGIW